MVKYMDKLSKFSMDNVGATVKDYFSKETAVTLGGVASGIAVGELAGHIVSQQWKLSPIADLGAKVGVKSGGAIVTRHLTKGRGNFDMLGISVAAGLGTSAVIDGIQYAYPRLTGKTVPGRYDWLSGIVDISRPPPALPPEENEKADRFLRRVPVRVSEEEPLEQPGMVI